MPTLGLKAVLGLAGLAVAGLGAGAARADAVADFEQIVKPMLPPNSLSYGSATASGPTAFTLSKVVLEFPGDGGKPVRVAVDSVTVSDIDFNGIKASQAPVRLSVRFDGIQPDFASMPADGKDADTAKMVAALWPKTTAANLAYTVVDGHLDLSDLSFDFPGLAKLSLTLALDGAVTDPKAAAAAAVGTSLKQASLTYEDKSLLSKVVIPLAALSQKTSDTKVLADAQAQLAALKQGQGPLASSAIDTVAAMLADYQAPKGPLKIALAPPTPPTFVTLAAKDSPDAILAALGATVTYNGTTVSSPGSTTTASAAPPPARGPHSRSKGGSAPASQQTASATPAPAACKEGDRLFVYSDDGWYAATVRDTTAKSGCVVRYDGHGAADDEVVKPDQIMAWSPDGPGTAVTACDKDAKVVGESDGVWYPATILDRSGKGCKVHWTVGDDPDEVLRLDQIRTIP